MRGVDQEHVVSCVVLVLAAITARRLSRILGALDASVGPLVAQRGAAGVGAGAVTGRVAVGGDPAVGTTMAAASASATLRRVANSIQGRVGASPSVRRVARSTTNRA